MICKYCNHSINKTALFCQNCSESTLKKRLKFSNLTESFFNNIFSLDKGLFLTLRTLLFEPNKVLKSYFHGGRRKYHSPLKLYATALFFSILIFSTSRNFNFNEVNAFDRGVHTGVELRAEKPVKLSVTYKSEADKSLNEKTVEKKALKQNAHVKDYGRHKVSIILNKLKENSKVMLQISFVLWIPISALFLMLFFRYRGFNYLENLAVSMYFSAISLTGLAIHEGIASLLNFKLDDFSSIPIAEPLLLILYFWLIRAVFYRKNRRFFLRFLGYMTTSFIGYLSAISACFLFFMLPLL